MSITAEKLKALVTETTISGWAMDFLSEAQWSIIADKLNAMISEQTPPQPTPGGGPEHCTMLAELRRLHEAVVETASHELTRLCDILSEEDVESVETTIAGIEGMRKDLLAIIDRLGGE